MTTVYKNRPFLFVVAMVLVAFSMFYQLLKQADEAYVSFVSAKNNYESALHDITIVLSGKRYSTLSFEGIVNPSRCYATIDQVEAQLQRAFQKLYVLRDHIVEGIISETLIPSSSMVRLSEYYTFLLKLPDWENDLGLLQGTVNEKQSLCNTKGVPV